MVEPELVPAIDEQDEQQSEEKFLEEDRQIGLSYFGRLGIRDEAVEEAIIARILFREGRKVGLSMTDLFPPSQTQGARGGPFYGFQDEDLTRAIDLLKERVREKGGTINIDASTINMGTVVNVDPERARAGTERSERIDTVNQR